MLIIGQKTLIQKLCMNMTAHRKAFVLKVCRRHDGARVDVAANAVEEAIAWADRR